MVSSAPSRSTRRWSSDRERARRAPAIRPCALSPRRHPLDTTREPSQLADAAAIVALVRHEADSREAERARISREIHDGPLQDLALLARDESPAHGAARQRRLQSVGADLRPVRAGLAVPLGAIPLLEPLVDTAPTLGDAVRTLGERFTLASVAIGVEVVDGPKPVDSFEVRFRTRPGLARFAEAEAWAATLVLTRLRAVFPDGAGDLVERVLLPRSLRPSPEASRLLGVPVATAEGYAALVVAGETRAVPLRTSDVAAHAVLGVAADHLGADRRRTVPLAEAVTLAHPSALARGSASIGEVADRLGYSARSLQRTLGGEGTSFSELLDAYRSAESCRLLATTSLPLSDVAAALGYAEQSAFTRAFARWRGTTPLRWRRENV